MTDMLKQAIAAAIGALLVVLITTIVGWISQGGFIRLLGGVSQTELAAEIEAAVGAVLPDKQPPAAALPAKTIVLTDQECAAIGDGWQPYEGLAGRFPLGAGETQDARGEARTFAVGSHAGTYAHQLTVDEIPSHVHPHHDRYFTIDGGGSDRGDEDDKERFYTTERRNTSATGGSQSHNNMPPYLVLNFCHKAESSG